MGPEPNSEREIFVSAFHMRRGRQRNAYLEEVCADRPALLDRLQTLLAASDIDDAFLTAPALGPDDLFASSDVTEQPGTVIGRYKLLERIGEGGMGVVYRAQQEQPIQREVALKIIRLGMDTKSVIARFEAERQALALMEHPNISRVFDAGATEAGRPYFVMELVRGVPITEYCRINQLGTESRLGLFMQVCQAVQHAHQKGIIHRDIKPTNILVAQRDGTAVPKIIDFGVARATKCELSEMALFTQAQAFVGTPAYMSPEQTETGGNDIDTRTDIYSLGVLLYELLTGTTPFESDALWRTGLDECRRMIREAPPARPSARVAALTTPNTDADSRHPQDRPPIPIDVLRSDLDWIVMKCLEKDRRRRYETANELVMDVQRYLRGEPILARPPSTLYRMRKRLRRNKVVVGATILLVLAAVVGSWQAVRATLAEREQSRLHGVAQEALRNEALQRRRAEAEEAATLQRAYNSDMNLVQQALAANNRGRVVSLLERYQPTPGRPDLRQWEWRYFWNQSRGQATVTLPAQSSPIEAVAVSPEGRFLASRDRLGRLKLWDLAQRAELAVLVSEGFGPQTFAFSRNGDRLAAASISGRRQSNVTVWTTATQQISERFSCAGVIQALVFDSDGTHLTMASQDTTVQVWDFAGQQLHAVHSPGAETRRRRGRQVAISASGALLAVGEGGRVRVLDMESGTERASADVFEGDIAALAFSGDEQLLAASPLFTGASRDIKLLSTVSGKETARLVGHRSWVPGVSFTPDGKRLVSAGSDQTIRVWNVENGRELAALQGHLSEVYCLAVAGDGRTVVSGGKEGELLGWDLEHLEPRRRFETLPTTVADFCFLPTSREILTVNADGTVGLWNTDTLQQEESITALGSNVHELLVSPDGKLLVASTRGHGLRVLDWTTRELSAGPADAMGRGGAMEMVGFIDDGRTLVTLGPDPTIRLWDTVSWQSQATWPLERRAPWFRSQSVLSPDQRSLIVEGFEGRLRFVDLRTGKTETVPGVEKDWGITGMAFTPDGALLATGSAEGTVSLWDAARREVVDELRGHLNGVHAVAFSPDGQRLASASQGDEAVKLWDITTRHEVATLEGEGFVRGHLRFSPDGTLLVAVNAAGTMHVWRAPSFDEIASPAEPSVPTQATRAAIQRGFAAGKRNRRNANGPPVGFQTPR